MPVNRRVAASREGSDRWAPATTAGERPARPPIAADDHLLDKDAAAAFLGVAPRTLYKWAAQGRLPVVRLGRSVRFRLSALHALVVTHEEPATHPLGGLVPTGTERALPTLP